MVDILKIKRCVMISISILALLLQTVLLAACSRTETPDMGVSGTGEDMVTENPDTAASEEANAGAAQPEDNRPEGEYEIEESLLTQEEAEALIEPLIQWAGLYMIGSMEKHETFDDALKQQMAGVTVAYGYLPEISSEIMMAEEVEGVWDAAPEGYLYASPEKIQAAEEWLFGETVHTIPVMDDLTGTGKVCMNDGEGGMLVMAGDWGLESPRGDIASIENMGGILNMVTVSYVLYDHEEDTVSEELGWIEYLIQGTTESGQTPKIIDMNIQVLYVNQDSYLYENWKNDATEWISEDYSLMLPGNWEERVHIYQADGADNFICSAAASENYMGVLFTIVRLQRGVAIEAPDYEILGENATGVYIAMFPTDVQFDPDDGYAAREYSDLTNYTEEILSTFQMR